MVCVQLCAVLLAALGLCGSAAAPAGVHNLATQERCSQKAAPPDCDWTLVIGCSCKHAQQVGDECNYTSAQQQQRSRPMPDSDRPCAVDSWSTPRKNISNGCNASRDALLRAWPIPKYLITLVHHRPALQAHSHACALIHKWNVHACTQHTPGDVILGGVMLL